MIGSVDDIICCDVKLMTSFGVLNNVAGNIFVVSIADVTERDDCVSDDVIETCDDVTAVCVSTAADETVSDNNNINNVTLSADCNELAGCGRRPHYHHHHHHHHHHHIHVIIYYYYPDSYPESHVGGDTVATLEAVAS